MGIYVMLKQTNRILILFTFCMAASVSIEAKDISNEQRNAYKARQEYNQNKYEYESLLVQISEQEKYLAQQQEKLDQLNAEKVSAKEKLDQSKQRLDAEVNALSRAWESRDQ